MSEQEYETRQEIMQRLAAGDCTGAEAARVLEHLTEADRVSVLTDNRQEA